MNQLWTVTYGKYDFLLDRRTRTYCLTETETGTVWAEGLSLGWIAVKNRETGEVTRYDFGELGTFSVSEKAGPQGKRILLGLDCSGIPIDIYLICSEREIQLVLESNRDSKTHTVEGFGLFPGLCAVPADETSYLVLPHREGHLATAERVRAQMNRLRNLRDTEEDPQECEISFAVWDSYAGVTMPFVGAVRSRKENTTSGLTLITDSLYATFNLTLSGRGEATLSPVYYRDPERRRLDVRIIPAPGADSVSIARTYREKIISDNNHVTLRRKLREQPNLERLFGCPMLDSGVFGLVDEQSLVETARILQEELGIARGIFTGVQAWHTQPPDFLCQSSETPRADRPVEVWDFTPPSFSEIAGNRWEALDASLDQIAMGRPFCHAVGTYPANCYAFASDLTSVVTLSDKQDITYGELIPVPLFPVVYGDCQILYVGLGCCDIAGFLVALLHLSLPSFQGFDSERTFVQAAAALLGPLQALTFPAFLTAHCFLTPDLQVEEAIYSDKTRVVINRSVTDDYEAEDLHLPPLGFYVRQAQLTAHDARRVGAEVFLERAWRIYRDGATMPTQQFPVPVLTPPR